MTAESLALAVSPYGFAVAVLAANGSGMNKDTVLRLGEHFNSRPDDEGITFLRRAEGYSQAMIAVELGVSQTTIWRLIHERLSCMASLLEPSIVT